MIFETMVFARDIEGQPRLKFDFDCRRYCTEEEAKNGHMETVLLIQATIQDIATQIEEET